ncbi:hypothetical protein GCM10010174_22820 [Kutzneria viridogrisea]|uniref:Aminoglycoside-2''-adenylyltransferase n=1 Tax=Kutzneria viridogrisea TaxID=47990 RepID=A0ABR6BTC1_9PSEU|nr:hypothetical protein [Kutzneria viridogrisea]
MADEEFTRLYGPWEVVDPVAAAALCEGMDAPWWVAGGWAIEAYAAVQREHGDIDLGVFRRDLPTVLEHFTRTHHVWAAGSGALQPITKPEELPSWATQLWIREHAGGPWLLDLLLTEDREGDWVCRRDPTVVLPLDEATWVSGGIRYLRPEFVLLFKAKRAQPHDEADLSATMPWLDAAGRHRCVDLIGRVHPGHPWLDMLS